MSSSQQQQQQQDSSKSVSQVQQQKVPDKQQQEENKQDSNKKLSPQKTLKSSEPKEQEIEQIDFKELKSGLYTIHVYLQETKDLINPRTDDGSGTVDPIIRIEAFDQKKNSTKKDKRGSGLVYWGEHIFFEKNFQEGNSFETEKMYIKVLDENLFGSDALIGEVEFDLASIYFSKDHVLKHKWFGLSNMEKKYNEIKGFLKLSINVVGAEDQQVELNDQDERILEEGEITDLMLPPQIKQETYELSVDLVKAEKIVSSDWTGSIDAYLIFEFGHAKFKTDIIEKNTDPQWGITISIPYQEPTVNQWFQVKLYDNNKVSDDEVIGTARYTLQDIKKGNFSSFFWLNIYGAQVGGKKTYFDIQNKTANLATFWKGRVLMRILNQFQPKALLQSKPMNKRDLFKYTASNDALSIELELIAEINFGFNFPDAKKKYWIQIRWGDKELNINEDSQQQGNFQMWYLRKEFNVKFPYCPVENVTKDDYPIKYINLFPDVFIYLMDDKKRICYIRKQAKDFLANTNKPKLFFFQPDRAVSEKIREDQAGIVQMRITLGQFLDRSQGDWNIPLQKPKMKEGVLYSRFYYGQNLLPADDNGSTDPYACIEYLDSIDHTRPLFKSLNPIWNQQLKVKAVFDENFSFPIMIKVFDKDYGLLGLDEDDFIGNAIVQINEVMNKYITYNQPFESVKPSWIDLKYDKLSDCGKVLASFHFFDYDKDPNPLPDPKKPVPEKQRNTTIKLETKPYDVKIRCLGMRNLQSLGKLPIKKPFIKFDVDSLREDPETDPKIREKKVVQTPIKDSGADPNIITIINFKVDLPVDLDFCPFLTCTVHDSLFKGLIQPILGTFSIDLGYFIKKTQDKLQKLQAHKELKQNAVASVQNQGKSQQFQKSQTSKFLATKQEQQMLTSLQTIDLNQQPNQILTSQKTIDLVDQAKQVQQQVFQSEQQQLQASQISALKNQLIDQSNQQVTEQDLENNKKIEQPIQQTQEKLSDQQKKQQQVEQIIEMPIDEEQEKLLDELEELDQEQQQEQFQQTLLKARVDPYNIVQYASYSYNEQEKICKEQNVPPENEYMGLGYDELVVRIRNDQKNIKKHYRKFIQTDLESSNFMDKHTFDEFTINRGVRVTEDLFFQKAMGLTTKQQVAGLFKAWVDITPQEIVDKKSKLKFFIPLVKGQMQKMPSETSATKNNYLLNRTMKISKKIEEQFLQSIQLFVRVYIVKIETIRQMDDDSLSDPYVKVILGKQKLDNRDKHLTDKDTAFLYERFDLTTTLPGVSQLKVQLWDYDEFIPDDFIGETTIDLENRYFSNHWRKLKFVPIEKRILKHPDSVQIQGSIYLWVEIFPESQKDLVNMVWEIQPKPPAKFELRVIVWEVSDIPNLDYEEASDLYVTCTFGDVKKKTDVHYRSQNGCGSFNWRMIFPLTLSQDMLANSQFLTFQLWDKDLFSPDDYFAESQVSFAEEAKFAFENDTSVKKYMTDNEFFTLDKIKNLFKNKKERRTDRLEIKGRRKVKKNQKATDLKDAVQGKFIVSIELVPFHDAKDFQVGEGRSEPNHSPWLPPPSGRMQFTLNPFKMFDQLMGPKFRRKLFEICCVLTCCILSLIMIPMIFANVVGNIITAPTE